MLGSVGKCTDTNLVNFRVYVILSCGDMYVHANIQWRLH